MRGPHAFFLVDQYDALKPWEKGNFLQSTGLTFADIEELRALRAAAETARESPRPHRSRQRRARSSRRRARVVMKHPRNRTDIRFTRRCHGPHTIVYVIFVERD